MTLEINRLDIFASASIGETALEWFENGYLPYPIIAGGKSPRVKADGWLENLNESEIERHWRDHPTDDVALYCIGGLVVLDADSVESQRAIDQLETKHELFSNLKVQTKKGVHYYYRQHKNLQIKQSGHSTELHPERIDIRCGRSYIIAPPSTDKELLVSEIVPFDALVEMTQAFVDDLRNHNGLGAVQVKLKSASTFSRKQKNASLSGELDQKLTAIRALISYLDPDLGYSEWLSVLMAIHNETNGSEAGLALSDEWSREGEKYVGINEIERKWNSFNQDSSSSVTMGTIWHLLQIQGLDPNQILSSANVITRVKNGRGKVSRLVGLVQPLEFRDFPHQATGRATKIPATIENFTYLMEMHGVDIRYNLVTKKTTVVIPHLKTTIDNADNVKLAHINSLCQLNNLSVGNVEKLCGAIADQNVFSPVEEWISSKQWDGVDRLDDFYSTLVADEEFPEEFKKTLMKRWMISAVAAVYMPKGFHCRGVLTLSGKQGLGKTSWIKSLVNDPDLCREVVLTGHCLDANNRDSQSTAIRNWLVELGELESTLRKDLPVLKSFITKDMDTFRKPYAECDSTFPRRTVFFASVNDANFLNDSTGNSRWWVIPVVEVNHLHGVDMQQVFAQVKEQLYDRGEAWWLSSVEEAQLTELNKDAEVISPVKELVITYLNEAMGVSTEFLTATSLLKRVGVERSTMGQCKEVSAVLTEKFGKKRKTSGNWGWDVPVRGGHCS